jgi:hypothetical protein
VQPPQVTDVRKSGPAAPSAPRDFFVPDFSWPADPQSHALRGANRVGSPGDAMLAGGGTALRHALLPTLICAKLSGSGEQVRFACRMPQLLDIPAVLLWPARRQSGNFADGMIWALSGALLQSSRIVTGKGTLASRRLPSYVR